MKFKQMIAIAVMACSLPLLAGMDMKTGTFATSATQTVYTNTVEIGGWGLGPVIGGTVQPRELLKVIIKNNTATNASVAIAMEDIADWTTLTGSPVTAVAGAQAIGYPARTYTETMAGYVVTNDVLVAATTTVTKSVPYWARKIRLITTLAATNAPSTVTWGLEYR